MEDVMEGVFKGNEEYVDDGFWAMSGERFNEVFSGVDLQPLIIEVAQIKETMKDIRWFFI